MLLPLAPVATAQEPVPAPRATAQAPAPAEVDALVAALGAPTRAARIAAQAQLLALPESADPLLASAVAPAGFEAQAALDYVRAHRPRRPQPCAVVGGKVRVGSSFPPDQNAPHDVELAPFTIDDIEVSCFEWWRFVREAGGAAPEAWRGGRYAYGAERVPVGGMTGDEARRFAQWAGGRLPTADEWEVAAHGGTPSAYPWGPQYEPRLQGPGQRTWRGDGLPPESGSEPADRAPCGAVDFCSSLSEWVVLPDGALAVRGGNYKAGAKELLRLTRAPDRRVSRARDVVGLRLADRRR